jgi:hypothetical protein
MAEPHAAVMGSVGTGVKSNKQLQFATWSGSLGGVKRSLGLCVLLASACGAAAPPPATTPAKLPFSASDAPREKPKPPPPFERFATVQNSGADTCKLSSYELGPADFLAGFPTTMTAGFGPWGGLAAWVGPARDQVSFRTLNQGGSPRGKVERASVPKNFKPRHVVGFEGGYVLIAELYEFSHERWAAIVTDDRGAPLGKMVELELEHRYVQDVSMPDQKSFVIFATRALMVPDDKQDLPGVWLDLTVGSKGALAQKAHELPLGFPLVRVMDQAMAFELGGKPGWFVQRGGEAQGELLLDGKLEKIARSALGPKGVTEEMLQPKGRVEFMLSMDENGSTFGRLADGKLIGQQLSLPKGSTGIADPVVWSGTHWVIPHATQTATASTAALVAIDCK